MTATSGEGSAAPPIEPGDLEVRPHESGAGYVLSLAGAPVTTPGGRELRHGSPRLLSHLLRDAAVRGRLEAAGLTPYALYALQKDVVEAGADGLLSGLEERVARDPLLYRPAAPDDLFDRLYSQLCSWYFVTDFLERSSTMLPVLTGEPGRVDEEAMSEPVRRNWRAFTALVTKSVAGLGPDARAGLLALADAHGSGVLLPLMLVTSRCSGEEYGEAVLATRGAPPHGPGWEAYRSSLLALREDAYAVVEYVAHHHDEGETEVRRLIRRGEGVNVEFKSTLRWNLKTGQKDGAIEHAVLKTVAAFLNTDGGTLLVGVADDGTIVGNQVDQLESRDKFERHFTQIVTDRLGVTSPLLTRTEFEAIDGRDVFRVDVMPSPAPVFLRGKPGEEEFFVRTGPQTVKLGVRDALDYARSRFERPRPA